MNSLMESDRATEAEKGRRVLPLVLAIVFLLMAAGLGYLGFRIYDKLEAVEGQVRKLGEETAEATTASSQALDEARRASEAATAAAEGRALAEAETERAKDEAESARQETESAKEETASAKQDAASARSDAATAHQEANQARAESERIRKEAEAELTRLQEALSKIAETHRTALGLVMNLGEDSLKFDFDKSDLKPENRELLSRIAGILMTSSDFTISVNGHTDDVGSEEYNQGLSERRAQAVRDYLVQAGVSDQILTVKGWGKTKPLVSGTTPEARAKNRRVELGIVNSRVNYRAPTEKN